MEHCYLISYDLCQPGRDYESLFDAIRRFPKWARLTESFWAIVCASNTTEIRDHLMRYMDANDRIIVIQSGRNAAWNNIIASSDWCRINLVQ